MQKPKSVDRVIVGSAFAAILLTVCALLAFSSEGTSASDTSRLVSVQQLPDNFDQCASADSSQADSGQADAHLMSLLERDDPASSLRGEAQQSSPAPDEGVGFTRTNTEAAEREAANARARGALTPVRAIRDTAPTYSAVAVDVNTNEVILQDNNLWEYQVFDRLSPTPKGPNDITPPKRTIRGDNTAIEFNNGLYVDPVSGDIYSVESDTGDKMERFAREAQGNESPISILHTPHRVYNIAADERTQELFQAGATDSGERHDARCPARYRCR
jgi:hypothetical protein